MVPPDHNPLDAQHQVVAPTYSLPGTPQHSLAPNHSSPPQVSHSYPRYTSPYLQPPPSSANLHPPNISTNIPTKKLHFYGSPRTCNNAVGSIRHALSYMWERLRIWPPSRPSKPRSKPFTGHVWQCKKPNPTSSS